MATSTKLDMKAVRKGLEERLEYQGRDAVLAQMKQLQIAVYVMVGGGWLGSSAANQPEHFYIDDRVSRRPYNKREIYRAVAILKMYAEILGFNPQRLDQDCPLKFDAHSCGVW